MPQDLVQTNFTSGELSPLVSGLVDQSKYYNGLEVCENFLVYPQGSIYRRGGTQYIAGTKNNLKARLVPFIFSASQAYILEFGANYIRFFAAGGQVMSGVLPYEIATDWDATGVWELNFSQSNDIIYLGRRGSPLKKLVRLAHDSWIIQAVPFIHPPTTMQSLSPSATLTPAAISGDNVLFTMSNATEVGKLAHGSDTATGMAVTSDFAVLDFVAISKGFTGIHQILAKTANSLQLDTTASLQTTGATTTGSDTLTSVADTTLFAVGDKVDVSAGFANPRTIIGKGSGTLQLDTTASSDNIGATISGNEVAATVETLAFLAGDVGRDIYYSGAGARATIVSYVNATQVRADIVDAFPDTDPISGGDWSIKGYSSTDISAMAWASNTGGTGYNANYLAGTSMTLAATSDAFRAADVDKYLPVWGGVLKITAYTSPTQVTASIIKDLTVRPASTSYLDKYKTAYWSVEEEAWNDAKGWPGSVCFFEGRLVAAGTDSFPQTIWASAVSNFEDFALGGNDSDAWAFTVAGDQLNNILWVMPLSAIMLGTTDQEWLLRGGNTPISPVNPPAAKAETGHGCSLVKPINLSSHGLFLQKGGRKLREMRYQFESDSFVSSDLMLLSDHVTAQYSLTQLARSQEPQQIIWAVREDGVLLSLTYQREHEVVAWARHVTDGLFESVAVIPGDLEDEVWVTVQRTIGGATKRYVERLNWFNRGDELEDAVFVDSALTYDGAAATVISGLDHLEGKEVAILADGAVHPAKTVSSGDITLEWAASKVQAGLPMTSTARTMRPEIPGGKVTTLQMVRRQVLEAMLRLDRSRGGKIGPDTDSQDELLYRKPADPMDEMALYSGDILVKPRTSSDFYGQLTIVCDEPLPFTLTMLALRLEGGVL